MSGKRAIKCKGGGNGEENCATKSFVAEPPASDVHDYALRRVHIVLDGESSRVPLDCALGEQCKIAIDSAAEMLRVSAQFCGETEVAEIAHMIRIMLRKLLNSVLDPQRKAQRAELDE